jgi:hypothetical protein
MITAYLVGDQQLLEWLDTVPGAINSGLVRSITRLGIGLQRTLQQDNIAVRVPTSRSAPLMSKSDFRIEQSDGTITASICLDFHNAVRKGGLAGTTNVRTSLRRKREAFISPSAGKVIGAPAEDGVPGLAEPSFLRSALDNITSAVGDEIDTTLAQATSQ